MMLNYIAGALMLTVASAAAAQTTTASPPPSATTPPPAAALPGAPPPPKPEGPAEVSRNAPVNGVLTLFGNERCPTDHDGNEIVVCVRRSAAEQFRIPKDLREFKITPANESWAMRAQGLVNDPGVAGGIGSCSTVGAGGQSGCFLQQAAQARAEKKEKKAEDKHVEDSLP